MHVYIADSSDPVRAARDFRGTPLGLDSPLIRRGDRLFVGVILKATDRPLLVEWHEGGITVDRVEDLVAVGNDPATCVLLVTDRDRNAARDKVFNCIVRHPRSYPDSVGREPRRKRGALGPGRLEHRARPGGDEIPRDTGEFQAADLVNEDEQIAVVAWDDLVQSMKTIEIGGTPVPLFVIVGNGRSLVAGQVRLRSAIEIPSLARPGVRLLALDLPTAKPLPALGGEEGFFVIGSDQ